MISKDDVFTLILNEYKNSQKPVSISKIKRKFKDESIAKVLEELEKEKKIRRVENKGKVSFEPIDSLNVAEELKILRDEIHRVLDLLQKLIESKSFSYKDFDEAYDRIKDSLGYAPLERIRIELGLSKEEFYSKFRKYIEENYDLIAGGDEGFTRKGVTYGIIKRRR
ncbi:conserved hypothetical protein [Sulfolobus islandicus Y.G.57.14]|jgi:hypothetical protein|uniref:Uncharacterized protein n=5 Tax=Saccharolobus islandicus TaxID=43080 RepID=C3NBS4_SACI7|nr:hypothetical protein [Sulfolobus islandicus]ACP39281.1 conserved hypothetical protein [Sulfolobus islandicus M.14.25]ACP46959.1 conserved hypothetical protein [Sulfolobus islandicus Y.G.57.14]ACP56463.1 conserved hypothetical protein [Sulfolobus islandicus M.16.27]ACR43149.1 conserved hypothetical protein [Sulfolobus islandicus M.16.4]ADB88482.1 conserved hypothetical protein [Sulfolobus islandicus L.D.8.5]